MILFPLFFSRRLRFQQKKKAYVVSMHSLRNITMIFRCHCIHKPIRHKLMFLKWYAYHLFFLQRYNYDVDGTLKSNRPQTYCCFKKLHRKRRHFTNLTNKKAETQNLPLKRHFFTLFPMKSVSVSVPLLLINSEHSGACDKQRELL